MTGRSLLCISAMVAGLFGAGPAEARCLPFEPRVLRASSDAAFEARMARHVAANRDRFGTVDWRCLMHGFEVMSDRTGAEAFRARGTPEGRVYRFVLGGGGDGPDFDVVFEVSAGQIARIDSTGGRRVLAPEA